MARKRLRGCDLKFRLRSRDYQFPDWLRARVGEALIGLGQEKYSWAPGTEFLGRIYTFYSAGQSKTWVDDSSEYSPEFFESFLEQFSVPPKSY